MTQAEIDRAVAHATGETVTTIRDLGFSVLEPLAEEPLVVDWEEQDQNRLGLFPGRRRHRGCYRRLPVAA